MSYKLMTVLALSTLLSMPAIAADMPDSATDATTPMDKQLGNQPTPTDNTLSNQEVEQSQHGITPGTIMTAKPTDGTPSVSGTTPSYKEKGGSAAKSESPDQ